MTDIKNNALSKEILNRSDLNGQYFLDQEFRAKVKGVEILSGEI